MNTDADLAEFAERFNVSRETIGKLKTFEQLAKKWSPSLNIVAKSTINSFWQRHIADSAAIFSASPSKSGKWLDLGSGGGLPGLVVAILASELAPKISATCVDSDIRKCEFMRTVARATGVSVGIISRRIEDLPAQHAQTVSARALAPLNRLLPLIQPHLASTGVAVLHKGENWQAEVDTALESWQFTVEKEVNPENPGSVILKIGEISSG